MNGVLIRQAIALVCAAILSLPAAGDDTPTEALPDVERWVDMLGSESFIQRDHGGRQLLAIGPPAIPVIVRATRSEDEITAEAAIRLLSRTAMNDRGARGTAAHRGLAQLAVDGKFLSADRRTRIETSVRAADRYVAGVVAARGGAVQRDDTLSIVAVQVNDERFTDDDALLLSRLIQLQQLDLRGTAVSNESIDAILALPQLTNLNLADTQITFEGLQQLASLKSLTKLSIYRLPASPSELKQLQAELPQCEIRF